MNTPHKIVLGPMRVVPESVKEEMKRQMSDAFIAANPIVGCLFEGPTSSVIIGPNKWKVCLSEEDGTVIEYIVMNHEFIAIATQKTLQSEQCFVEWLKTEFAYRKFYSWKRT